MSSNNEAKIFYSNTEVIKSTDKDNIHTKRLVSFLYFFYLFFASGVISILVVAFFIPPRVLIDANQMQNNNISLNLAPYLMLGSIISTLSFLAIVSWRTKEVRQNFNEKLNRNKIRTTAVIIVLYFIVAIVMSYIIKLIAGNDAINGNSNQNQVEKAIRAAPILAFMSVVLLGPIMEEIAFRYGVMGSFKNKYFGLIFSAIVFGFLHLLSSALEGKFIEDIWTLPSYLLMGFTLGLIYFKTDNIVYSLSFHIFNNLLAFVFVISK